MIRCMSHPCLSFCLLFNFHPPAQLCSFAIIISRYCLYCMVQHDYHKAVRTVYLLLCQHLYDAGTKSSCEDVLLFAKPANRLIQSASFLLYQLQAEGGAENEALMGFVCQQSTSTHGHPPPLIFAFLVEPNILNPLITQRKIQHSD
jgi:hypothetical protein